MKKRIILTYLRHKSTRGFKGNWVSNYFVSDITDAETGEVLAAYYEFSNSKIFKGKGFREGDKVEAIFTVEGEGANMRFLRPQNLHKLGE